jgi:FtsH-binding integral membrane protein
MQTCGAGWGRRSERAASGGIAAALARRAMNSRRRTVLSRSATGHMLKDRSGIDRLSRSEPTKLGAPSLRLRVSLPILNRRILCEMEKEANMSNYDQNTTASGAARTDVIIDAGLRAYMLNVYNHMAAGVGLTAVVAWLTYQLTGPALLQSPLMWVFILAPLVLVFFISARINTLSVSAARSLFFVYAALVGVSLSILFHIYTNSSITRVFFITAATFGALSLYGYTTRRDLSGFGTFLFMGLIGIIIASLVNLFMRSTQLDWLISIVGVGVFAGLTAYDTQRIKAAYDRNDDATSAGRKAVIGALSLYLDFINLFMMLLRLAGNRR